MSLTKNEAARSSAIFRRSKTLGLVCNNIPVVVRYVQRRKDTLIISCTGRVFHIYTASHLRLIHVSGPHPADITALSVNKLYTFTASNKCIFAWRAGKHIRHMYRKHSHDIHLLFPFGKHLVAIDKGNTLKVWEVETELLYLEISFKKDEFEISAITHMPTYINKIILGSKQGLVKIWNLKDNRLIYTSSKYECAITCMEPTPALDVVAIGYQDGFILFLNLKYDEQVLNFKQDWGAVAQLSFRTDGPLMMASGCKNGQLVFWNLEEQRISGQVLAHEMQVTTVICLPNEPLILSSSPDNSIKLWIFDMPDDGARLLRLREGHSAPPLCIRYHGSTGCSILSSGEDSSLRVFSTITETFNKSMGKALFNKSSKKKSNNKMPPITSFTTEVTREKEWDNIVAIHAGFPLASTWSFHHSRMGKHLLHPKNTKNSHSNFKLEATCLTLSFCGNFVIIGYSSGDVERFNVQSGLHRASYGQPAHNSSISGLATDSFNKLIMSSCYSGFLKFWPFKAKDNELSSCLEVIQLEYGVALMRIHRESNMIALALVNFVIYIVDVDTRKIIRKFEGHLAKINDLTFSQDSRMIIAASMDSTIKTWDISSSYMVDSFKVETPCTSLSISASGEYLATAHVNSLGIVLWVNKMIYGEISLRRIDSRSKEDEKARGEYNDLLDNINFKYKTPAQLANNLITVSNSYNHFLQNGLDFEKIKKRNKPNAIRKPKAAPFLLPTVAGLELKFNIPAVSNGESYNKENRGKFSNLTLFAKMLEESASSHIYDKCMSYLEDLGPSKLNFEIKSLNPFDGGSYLAMKQFLRMIVHVIKSNTRFELVQTYLSIFLAMHGSLLPDIPDILELLQNTLENHEKCWKTIETNCSFGISVIAMMRNLNIS